MNTAVVLTYRNCIRSQSIAIDLISLLDWCIIRKITNFESDLSNISIGLPHSPDGRARFTADVLSCQ